MGSAPNSRPRNSPNVPVTETGDGELWGGVPAKFIKKVDPEQAQALNKTYARHYIEYSDWFREADSDPANTQTVTTSEDYKPQA